MLPLGVAPRPAEGPDAVQDLTKGTASSISRNRYVGDEADKKEHCRDRKVCRDRKYVPKQWRSKVWPKSSLVRVWKEPVSGKPGTSGMNDREQACGHDRKYGHRLGD